MTTHFKVVHALILIGVSLSSHATADTVITHHYCQATAQNKADKKSVAVISNVFTARRGDTTSKTNRFSRYVNEKLGNELRPLDTSCYDYPQRAGAIDARGRAISAATPHGVRLVEGFSLD